MINDTEIYYDALSIPTIKYEIEKKSYIGSFQPKLEIRNACSKQKLFDIWK